MIQMLIAVLIGVLVALPVVGWMGTVVLVRAARQRPHITFLTDRAISMALKSAGSSIIAALAINGVLMFVHIERPWSTLIIAIAILLLEVPALLFVVLYLTGRFRDYD